MAFQISRPSLPTEKAEAGIAVLQASAQKLVDGLETDSTDLGRAQRTTLTLAQSHCLLDPRASIFPTWDAWVTAMQVSSAAFAAATTSEIMSSAASRTRTARSRPPDPSTM